MFPKRTLKTSFSISEPLEESEVCNVLTVKLQLHLGGCALIAFRIAEDSASEECTPSLEVLAKFLALVIGPTSPQAIEMLES